MPDQPLPPQDSSPRTGRAAPRSRLGCATCKQRHVRCDEASPVCGHCNRLQLRCHYPPQPQGNKRKGRNSGVSTQRKLLPSQQTRNDSIVADCGSSPPNSSHLLNEQPGAVLSDSNLAHFISSSWLDDMLAGAATLGTDVPDLGSSWAGEFRSFMKPHTGTSVDTETLETGESLLCVKPNGKTAERHDLFSATELESKTTGDTMGMSKNISLRQEDTLSNSSEYVTDFQYGHLYQLPTFEKLMQPPAAMLMGGIRRWQHLQRYLLNLGSRNEVVMSALLCLEEVLASDDSTKNLCSTEGCKKRILERYHNTRSLIEGSTATSFNDESQQMDELLAAIFLLAWVQVIYDRGKECDEAEFPCHQADVIICSGCDWNWYSRQLLSWFNSLDSKATHLGSAPLLSPKALRIVSRYPIQIITCDYEESKERQQSLVAQEDFRAMSSGPVSEASEHGDSATIVPSLTACDVKEIVLRAILQPSAEWYLQTQAYCRQIGSLDKHHRTRFTPDDELEVALTGKHLQSELWDLWAQRPSAISLTSDDLAKSVAPDMAIRLQEVFSVYLASFWILFVYLHRICWWHLSHPPTITGALEEAWRHMQSSYGEADDASGHKTVHPALMWPVFLLGAECTDENRQEWAVDQLRKLGRSKPVLQPRNTELETLPSFRLSQGATKNARRAALLLETLIRKQEEAGCRVDDRDLAIDMFGCYFSIV